MSSVQWIEEFNEYNREYDIYRTIIITRNQEMVYASLIEAEYDVFYQNPHFEEFIEEKKRILIISIEDFRNYSVDCLYNIKGEHNFIVVDKEFSEEVLNTFEKFKNTTLKENYYVWII
jgi:hypothetical protein